MAKLKTRKHNSNRYENSGYYVTLVIAKKDKEYRFVFNRDKIFAVSPYLWHIEGKDSHPYAVTGSRSNKRTLGQVIRDTTSRVIYKDKDSTNNLTSNLFPLIDE